MPDIDARLAFNDTSSNVCYLGLIVIVCRDCGQNITALGVRRVADAIEYLKGID
jgi:hypothetical protein